MDKDKNKVIETLGDFIDELMEISKDLTTLYWEIADYLEELEEK